MLRFAFSLRNTLLLSFILWCWAVASTQKSGDDHVRYDNFRIYGMLLENQKVVEIFQQLEASSDDIIFMGHPRKVNKFLMLVVPPHRVADVEDLLEEYGIKTLPGNTNIQEGIDKSYSLVQPRNISIGEYDWNHHFHLETINAWLERKARRHRQKVTLLNIGNSNEGHPMIGLKISRNSSANQAIFVGAGIHGREWLGTATATYIIKKLLSSRDAKVNNLTRNIDWYIFPVLNPDGYKFSFDGDRLWFKNRRSFGKCRGVDLNRNFPYQWNSTGTSGNPCRNDYSGSEAASEIETQNIMNFIKANFSKQKHRAFFALHDYLRSDIIPFGPTVDGVDNLGDLKEIAVEGIKTIMGPRIPRDENSMFVGTDIDPSGSSINWAYKEMRIPIVFDLESFLPRGNILTLMYDDIKGSVESAFDSIINMVEASKAKKYFE